MNDTLIINVSLGVPNKITNDKDIIVGYENDKLRFINILNASKHIKNLKNGLLFPTADLLAQIKVLTQIDLSKHLDNGFKVGVVERCEDIKGTHLHKCLVDVKNAKLHIVCGASNCRQGLKVVVATNGTMLPNGKLIMAGSLLGNKSEGMLCSYKELSILKDSKGIVELDKNYQVGDCFKEVYKNI